MVTICAWCQRYLGSREPFDVGELTHGICEDCRYREQHHPGGVLLVVSREREDQLALLRATLRGAPADAIVLDRRHGERRKASVEPPPGATRRRVADRRRQPCLYVI
jgi:hypothetical protein